MEIIIDNESFSFDDKSSIEVTNAGYKLQVTEPGFDQDSEEVKRFLEDKEATLPHHVEILINRCRDQLPSSRISEDSSGKKKLFMLTF